MPKTITIDGQAMECAFISPAGVFRVNRNTVEEAGDGGQISIVTDATEDDTLNARDKIAGATVLFNYRKDDPLRNWPFRKATMEEERYTVIVVKVPREQQARTVRAAARAEAARAAAAEEQRIRDEATKEIAPTT
jgi:hypothetical protein